MSVLLRCLGGDAAEFEHPVEGLLGSQAQVFVHEDLVLSHTQLRVTSYPIENFPLMSGLVSFYLIKAYWKFPKEPVSLRVYR